MAVMKVRLIDPQATIAAFETDLLNVVAAGGAMGIMPNHTPLVVSLQISHIRAKVNGVAKEYAVAGGILSFKDNEAIVVSNAIEDMETIDIDRAKRAKERAEKRLASNQENIDIKRAQLALQRALNRLK